MMCPPNSQLNLKNDRAVSEIRVSGIYSIINLDVGLIILTATSFTTNLSLAKHYSSLQFFGYNRNYFEYSFQNESFCHL